MQRVYFAVTILIDDLVGYDQGPTLVRCSNSIHTEAAI